jgi:hypothetical protein
MTGSRLAGKRILVTSCTTYMGPPITELFRAEGADVVADPGALLDPVEPDELLERTGHVDAVIANLDLPAYGARLADIDDARWVEGFDAMVHPLMRLVRAASRQMVERGSGSIVAITSSSPLRRMTPHAISYVAARAAQNAFVRSAGSRTRRTRGAAQRDRPELRRERHVLPAVDHGERALPRAAPHRGAGPPPRAPRTRPPSWRCTSPATRRRSCSARSSATTAAGPDPSGAARASRCGRLSSVLVGGVDHRMAHVAANRVGHEGHSRQMVECDLSIGPHTLDDVVRHLVPNARHDPDVHGTTLPRWDLEHLHSGSRPDQGREALDSMAEYTVAYAPEPREEVGSNSSCFTERPARRRPRRFRCMRRPIPHGDPTTERPR